MVPHTKINQCNIPHQQNVGDKNYVIISTDTEKHFTKFGERDGKKVAK